MDLDDLTPELKEKALACKTAEEFLALAKEEGFELTNEQLDTLSGGATWDSCNSKSCSSYCPRKDSPGYC